MTPIRIHTVGGSIYICHDGKESVEELQEYIGQVVRERIKA